MSETIIKQIYKSAQLNMLKDGFLLPIIFLVKNKKLIPIAIDRETQVETFSANMTAAVVDASAIMLVSEAWGSEFLMTAPEEDPDRIEVVQVVWMDAEGKTVTVIGNIQRTESGRAYLEDFDKENLYVIENTHFIQWKYAEGQDHTNTILITDCMATKH